MREFFKGWRRKVGLVTLVMALVFTGGWLRSRFFEDSVIIPRSSSSWRVASNQYGIHLVDARTFSTEAAAVLIPRKTQWHSTQIDYSKPAYFDSAVGFEWHRTWCGFGSRPFLQLADEPPAVPMMSLGCR